MRTGAKSMKIHDRLVGMKWMSITPLLSVALCDTALFFAETQPSTNQPERRSESDHDKQSEMECDR